MSNETPDTTPEDEKAAEPLYPEHEKMDKVRVGADAITEFLEFLTDSKQIELGSYVTLEGYSEQRFLPVHESSAELIAGFYGIDLKKLEAERRQMLDAFTAQNG